MASNVTHDGKATPTNLVQTNLVQTNPVVLYWGLYTRVARKLGVDRSYVSRVASGQRRSRVIELALREEIAGPRRSTGTLRQLILDNRAWFTEEWAMHALASTLLSQVKLPRKRRLAPLWPLVQEMLNLMQRTPGAMALESCPAAVKHCKSRRDAGFAVTALLEEYNLLRRCVFTLAEKNTSILDHRVLLHDLAQVQEALDMQMLKALSHLHS